MPTFTSQTSLPFGNQVPTFGRGGAATAAPAIGKLPAYNLNPTPTGGQGPYGSVPGQIGAPPSTFQQTISSAPGLGAATSTLTGNIMNELQGDISPQALKNMQDAAARYGVSSGMPGSNAIPGTLAFNRNLRNIGLDTQQVQRQGQQDYLSALGGIGGQQLNPSLLAEIAQSNAQLGAAPDPAQAAQLQMQLYQQALAAARGPGGATTGGVGGASPTGLPTAGFTPGFGAGGTPNPATLGGTATASSYTPGATAGGQADPWQTGVGADQSGYQSWGTDLTGLDPFGDLGGGTDQYAAYANPDDFYNYGG